MTPWTSPYKPAGLLSFTVGENGNATATGRLVDKTISFMALRAERGHRVAIADVLRGTDIPDVTCTDLHAHHVCQGDATFAIGWQVPYCQWEYLPADGEDDRWCVWFLDRETRSWARFDYHPDTRSWPVSQCGPRRLWDEVAAAHQRWADAGCPVADCWRFIVSPEGQSIELDQDPSR